jgi:hypothetical protein
MPCGLISDAHDVIAGRKKRVLSSKSVDCPRIMTVNGDDPEILRPVLARFAANWGASVDCGPGWWPIIAELDRQVAAIAPDYEVHQIKEKFGGLRFYYGMDEVGSDPRIDELIDHAEQIAARTCEMCEMCGAPARAPRRRMDQDGL